MAIVYIIAFVFAMFLIFSPICFKIKNAQLHEQTNRELDNIGFCRNQMISFKSQHESFNFYIDKNLKKIACEYRNSFFQNIITVDFHNITKYEIIFDNSIVKENAAGNAMLGGIIAGGVGAFIGASSAKNKEVLDKVAIHIYQKSGNPLTYTLSDSTISRVSNEYAQLVQKLDAISNYFDSVLSNKFESSSAYLEQK